VSDTLLAAVVVVAAMVSLATSWVLVSRLERVGARLGLSKALLGMLTARAADAPEITASVTALAGHQSRIGAGVVIGSNVFNLAALLGFAAVVASEIALHRRVIVLEGVAALSVAAVCLAVLVGVLSPAVGLLLVVAVLVPYLVVLGVRHDRLRRIGVPCGVDELADRRDRGRGARAWARDPSGAWPRARCGLSRRSGACRGRRWRGHGEDRVQARRPLRDARDHRRGTDSRRRDQPSECRRRSVSRQA
jgi:hypothetical protein